MHGMMRILSIQRHFWGRAYTQRCSVVNTSLEPLFQIPIVDFPSKLSAGLNGLGRTPSRFTAPRIRRTRDQISEQAGQSSLSSPRIR